MHKGRGGQIGSAVAKQIRLEITRRITLHCEPETNADVLCRMGARCGFARRCLTDSPCPQIVQTLSAELQKGRASGTPASGVMTKTTLCHGRSSSGGSTPPQADFQPFLQGRGGRSARQ